MKKKHITDMPHCWCNPTKLGYPNGVIHIIHNELDNNQIIMTKDQLKMEIDFIETGIQACKDDVNENKIEKDELNYIFGKSQALKIIKARLESYLN